MRIRNSARDTVFTLENMEDYEKKSIRGLKWWSLNAVTCSHHLICNANKAPLK